MCIGQMIGHCGGHTEKGKEVERKPAIVTTPRREGGDLAPVNPPGKKEREPALV